MDSSGPMNVLAERLLKGADADLGSGRTADRH